MQSDWVEFLRAPSEAGHAVQVYAHLDELAESVAAYLALGFATGDPAVVVATPEHEETFTHFLGATGWDADVLLESGLLTVLSADETLSAIMDGEDVSPSRFEQVVGSVIDRASKSFPGRRVRVFGEMVDLLTARGREDTAAVLEGLWNELAQTRNFALLCGYRLDVFDPVAQTASLPAVCESHTHVLAAYDVERFDRAVHDALDEVLGSSNARMVHGIVSDDAACSSASLAEQMLMWVSERMPRHAERVLEAARAKYVLPVAEAV
jgi:hypothetical protein